MLGKAIWSEHGCWQGQPLAGSLPVQALCNREHCCTEPQNLSKAWELEWTLKIFYFQYLGLIVYHHTALIPCSDWVFLECLQLFPSRIGPCPALAVGARDYLPFGVQATVVIQCSRFYGFSLSPSFVVSLMM